MKHNEWLEKAMKLVNDCQVGNVLLDGSKERGAVYMEARAALRAHLAAHDDAQFQAGQAAQREESLRYGVMAWCPACFDAVSPEQRASLPNVHPPALAGEQNNPDREAVVAFSCYQEGHPSLNNDKGDPYPACKTWCGSPKECPASFGGEMAEVMNMTEPELDAALRAEGIDPEKAVAAARLAIADATTAAPPVSFVSSGEKERDEPSEADVALFVDVLQRGIADKP